MPDIAGTLFYKHWPTQNPLMSDEAQDLVRTCIGELTELKPADEWHEDMGDVLWYRLPIEEPPHVGSPLDTNWFDEHPFPFHPMVSRADYYTHFQRIHIPEH